jgi:hypothetical protein
MFGVLCAHMNNPYDVTGMMIDVLLGFSLIISLPYSV